MIDILLSVIIPTRERAKTLACTLATAGDQKSDDYEIIVSDNASEDETPDIVGVIEDPRLRYFRTPSRLSMCDNYEFALQHANGEYVIIIGDDDAVIPGMLDSLLARLRKLKEPTIHMWPLHIYDWPVESRTARATYIAPIVSESILNLKQKARQIMSLGGWKYYELPSPYHAAIPRHILDSIRLKTGRVFHSTQPDVFTAMAIPAFADHAVNIGQAVTFNGRSAQSNGLGFVKRKAVPNIERFIKEYGDYRFHPSLYDGVSAMANMIPDAVLIAKEKFPSLYEESAFDYSAMWAYVARLGFVSHLKVITNIEEIRQSHNFSPTKFLVYSAIHEAAALRRTGLNFAAEVLRSDNNIPSDIQAFAKKLATR